MPASEEYNARDFPEREPQVDSAQPESRQVWAVRHRDAHADAGECLAGQQLSGRAISRHAPPDLLAS